MADSRIAGESPPVPNAALRQDKRGSAEPCPRCGRERTGRRKDAGIHCRACANGLWKGRKRRADGLAHSKLDELWKLMMRRCGHRPGATPTQLRNYAERGIAVCEKWQRDKGVFFQWALANGYVEGLQIDREKNHLGYEPSNCRFVTARVNARNRRTGKLDADKAATIKRRLCAGEKAETIAPDFGVTKSMIMQIRWGSRWAEIDPSTIHLVRYRRKKA